MGPHDERQNRDRRGRVDHGGVAEQTLAGKRWNDFRDDPKRGQDHDVDLGMPKEPENMLEHHRVTTAGGIKEVRPEVPIGQGHRDRTGQHRHHSNQQVGGNQPGPDKHRHLHQRHPGRAHVEDGGNDVDRAHDRAGAEQVDCKDHHVHARTHLERERRIHRPASSRCSTRCEVATHQQKR